MMLMFPLASDFVDSKLSCFLRNLMLMEKFDGFT